MAAISTVFTTLIMTGKIAPGILNPEQGAPAAPIKSTLDLLNDDFTEQKISADQYALFIKDYLIRYDSLPAHYKTSRITINSTEMYAALLTMWPRVNLRTRSDILKIMPFLEQKWQSLNIQAEQNE
jgi:hypothetical protein